MDKQELVARAAERARKRGYFEKFSGAMLNDLIKEGLVPEGKRNKNRGKHPTYDYDYRCYRRVLQILRLRRLNIVNRDAVCLQLFIRGYGVNPHAAREALQKEHRKANKQLWRSARSSYLGNFKDVPPKHKRSLINSMGPIDARFTASGLAPHSDALIEIARAAKQMPVSTSQASPRSINAALSSNVVPIAKHQLAGLLNLQVDGPEIRRNLQEKCKAIDLSRRSSESQSMTIISQRGSCFGCKFEGESRYHLKLLDLFAIRLK